MTERYRIGDDRNLPIAFISRCEVGNQYVIFYESVDPSPLSKVWRESQIYTRAIGMYVRIILQYTDICSILYHMICTCTYMYIQGRQLSIRLLVKLLFKRSRLPL